MLLARFSFLGYHINCNGSGIFLEDVTVCFCFLLTCDLYYYLHGCG